MSGTLQATIIKDGASSADNITLNATGGTTFGGKVLGDYTNATVASRSTFQTSTTNGSTGIYALPNGTSTAASWQATNNADPTNASKILIATNASTDVQLVSGINGTGTYLPLSFYTNGTQQMQLSTAGILTGTAGNLMLVQGTAQASTSGTNIDFTGIPSWVKRITVLFSGVSTNGASNIQVQIGSTTFTTSGYAAGAMITSSSGLQAINNTTGFPLESTNTNLTATSVRNGSMQINLVTGNTWVSSSAIGYSAGTAYVAIGGGSIALGGTLDRLRVTTVAGDTFDAGTINIQYE
jgi:hypothetical protein